MAKTVCDVRDEQTANKLRGAALAAGMLARIDRTITGIQVTIDHLDERRPSAEHLAYIHGLAVLAVGYRSADSQQSRVASLGIATAIVADERGISLERARAWLQVVAGRGHLPIDGLAQAIIHGQQNVLG